METIHTEIYKGKTICIIPDSDPINPREDDNITTMACFHRRYNLGDKTECKDFDDLIISLWLEHATELELKTKLLDDLKPKSITDYRNLITSGQNWRDRFDYIYSYEKSLLGKHSEDLELPHKVTWSFLYLYDHSGITISMTPFSCMFDSGIVGIIYMIDDDANPMTYDEQLKIMKGDVKAYDDYLTGNCYGFIIKDENDEEIDSCWGFLGDYEYCLESAKEAIN
jgi:hypothetical protein